MAAIWAKEQYIIATTLICDNERPNLPAPGAKTLDSRAKKEDIQRMENLIKRRRSFAEMPLHEDSYYERILDLLGQRIVRVASNNELGFANEKQTHIQNEIQETF